MKRAPFFKSLIAATVAITAGTAPANPQPTSEVELINIYTNPMVGVGDAHRNFLGEVSHEISDDPTLAVIGAVSAADVALAQRAISRGKEAHAEARKQMTAKRVFFEYSEKQVAQAEADLDKNATKNMRTLDPENIDAAKARVLDELEARAQTPDEFVDPTSKKITAYVSEVIEMQADSPRKPMIIDIEASHDGKTVGVRTIQGTADEVFKALDDLDYSKVEKVYVEWKDPAPLDAGAAERLHLTQQTREERAGTYRDAKKTFNRADRFQKVQRFFRKSGVVGIAAVIGVGIFRSQSVQDWLMGLSNMESVCNSPQLMELKARGAAEETLVHARELGREVDEEATFATHEAALEDFCNQINENI